MKYWIFHNNQVLGPFDPEQLAQQKGFSVETLVCPEGRKGIEMGDWQRAGVVPDLAQALLRDNSPSTPATRLTGSSLSSLPPEPTLKDLAALGTLHEKVGLLETSMAQLRQDLASRDSEIAHLKVQLGEKEKTLSELRSKQENVDSRLAQFEALQAQLEGVRQEIRGLEPVRQEVQALAKRLEESRPRMPEQAGPTAPPSPTAAPSTDQGPAPISPTPLLESTFRFFPPPEPISPVSGSGRGEFVGSEPSVAGSPKSEPLPSVPKEERPAVMPSKEGQPAVMPLKESQPSPVPQVPGSLPQPAPSFVLQPISLSEPAVTPTPIPSVTFPTPLPVSASPPATQPPTSLPTSEVPAKVVVAIPESAGAMPGPVELPVFKLPPERPVPAQPPMVAEAGGKKGLAPAAGPSGVLGSKPLSGSIEFGAAQPPKPKRKPVLLIVMILAATATAGLYWISGHIPNKRLSKKTNPGAQGESIPPFFQPPPTTRPGVAAPSEVAAPPGAPVGAAGSIPPVDLSQVAVEFAKAYRLSGADVTLGQKLEGAYPPKGQLSPWMVEKLPGMDNYQVNFYVSGSKPMYEFLVHPKAKILQGKTEPTQALLRGEPLVSLPPRKKVTRQTGRSSKRSVAVASRAQIQPTSASAPLSDEPPSLDALLQSKLKAEGGQADVKPGLEGSGPETGGPSLAAPGAQPTAGPQEPENLSDLLLPGLERKVPAKTARRKKSRRQPPQLPGDSAQSSTAQPASATGGQESASSASNNPAP